MNRENSDTSPEIKKMVFDMMMARSGEERFIMGAQMFDDARAMVLASLPKDLSPREVRRQLFERLYGSLDQYPGFKLLL